MKLLIEDSDVHEVKTTLEDRYGIILSDSQARSFIERHNGLAASLYECEGSLDTQGREHMLHLLVEEVMKGVPESKYGKKHTVWTANGAETFKTWSWPTYGDSGEYSFEFNAVFKKAALMKGFGLDESWNK